MNAFLELTLWISWIDSKLVGTIVTPFKETFLNKASNKIYSCYI